MDLRRTFATRLRALRIHEYDIKDFTRPHDRRGHFRLCTFDPDGLENAVEQLAESLEVSKVAINVNDQLDLLNHTFGR